MTNWQERASLSGPSAEVMDVITTVPASCDQESWITIYVIRCRGDYILTVKLVFRSSMLRENAELFRRKSAWNQRIFTFIQCSIPSDGKQQTIESEKGGRRRNSEGDVLSRYMSWDFPHIASRPEERKKGHALSKLERHKCMATMRKMSWHRFTAKGMGKPPLGSRE